MNITAQLKDLTIGKGGPKSLKYGRKCASQEVISLFL